MVETRFPLIFSWYQPNAPGTSANEMVIFKNLRLWDKKCWSRLPFRFLGTQTDLYTYTQIWVDALEHGGYIKKNGPHFPPTWVVPDIMYT